MGQAPRSEHAIWPFLQVVQIAAHPNRKIRANSIKRCLYDGIEIGGDPVKRFDVADIEFCVRGHTLFIRPASRDTIEKLESGEME